MSESKHTPGPWTAAMLKGQYWQILLPTGEPLCVLSWINNGWLNRGVNEATANTIAAAPELLAALEALFNEHCLHTDRCSLPTHQQARAAIAKAMGGQG